MTATHLRIAVVDDHEMFAESIARVLATQPDLEVVGVARTSAEGAALVEATRPDVAVLDYQLPDADGAEAAARLRAVSPETRVLILTGLADERLLTAAIDAGCAGFLTKDRAVDELVRAVRLVHAGDAYVPPGMLANLLPRLGRNYRGVGTDLTPREREVLELLALGLSNQAIAERLVLSVHTVRHHVQNVLAKLGAHSKLEAVATAREGILKRPT
jgi:two-component system, NarL family, response regulator DevR